MRILSFFSILFLLSSCPALHAQVFHYVVAKDGSGNFTTLQAALDAVPSNSANRTTIFVKKGYYFEKCKITNKTNVSLIGENRDSVVLAYNDYSGKVSGMSGATAMTLLADAAGFYMENISVRNTSGNVGQAPAIKTTGDKMVFKNCAFYGYQDTYYANKNRQYSLECYVEGAVDFVYGDAQAVYDKCTIHCVRTGSVCTAPADPKSFRTIDGVEFSLGLYFNECNLTADASVSAASCHLGRPWGLPKATSVFTKCTLGKHVSKAGWNTMTTDAEKTAFFAEYKSVQPDGSPFDVTSRIGWSKQLTETQYQRCYNPDSFLFKTSSFWFPKPMVAALPVPTALTMQSNMLRWEPVASSIGYVVYRNKSAIGITQTTDFTDTAALLPSGTFYQVCSVSANGNLSPLSGAVPIGSTALSNPPVGDGFHTVGTNLFLDEASDVFVHTVSGALVRTFRHTEFANMEQLPDGFYVCKIVNQLQGRVYSKLLQLKRGK